MEESFSSYGWQRDLFDSRSLIAEETVKRDSARMYESCLSRKHLFHSPSRPVTYIPLEIYTVRGNTVKVLPAIVGRLAIMSSNVSVGGPLRSSARNL